MAAVDKLLKRAEEHFDAEESALQAIQGLYETTVGGARTVRRGIFVATSQRLVFYAKRLTGYDIESFPYKSISSMEMGKKFLGHYIEFFASGNSAKMTNIIGDVAQFVDAVRAQMEAKQSGATEEPPGDPHVDKVDPVDQLERLAKLRESGVLTDAEFEEKKKLILARL